MKQKKSSNIGHNKKNFLDKPVEHIDIKSFDARKIIDSMKKMSFTSRDTANAAGIFNEMFQGRPARGFASLCDGRPRRIFRPQLRRKNMARIASPRRDLQIRGVEGRGVAC